MSLMSAAFAKTTMPDNNAMNLTRSSQTAWGPRRLLQDADTVRRRVAPMEQYQGMSPLLLLAIVLVVPPVTPPRTDLAAIRQAAFTEALRVAKTLPPHSQPPIAYCLAIESGADPPRDMVAALAKDSGLSLFPYSDCLRKGLFIAEGGLHGFNNLVAIDSISWSSSQNAHVDMRLFGGTGRIAVTLEKGKWKGVCCSGGIVG